MGAISSAMKSLFRSSARSAAADASGAGKQLGRVFFDGLVAQLGGIAAEALTSKLKEKLVGGSKAAAEMGQASQAAAATTSTAMQSAANAAQTTQTKIINITKNIYNMQNAYITTANAAQQAGREISRIGNSLNDDGAQRAAEAYGKTAEATKEVAVNVIESADAFEASQNTMSIAAKKTPTAIQRAWESLKAFWADLWERIGNIAQRGLERIKAGWEYVKSTIASISSTAQSAMSSISGAFSTAASYLQGFASKAFWVSTAITIAFTAAVAQSARHETQMRKFNIVFGESADSIRKWAGDFEKAGLGGFSGTIQQLAQFQDTLKPMGMASGAAAELSRQLVSLGTDLASFNGMDTADVFRDLLSALTGSGEVMKKYGVILTEAAVKEKLLADGLDPESATNAEKAYARFQIILEGCADALGFAGKSANEYDGITRALREEIKGLTADIGALLKDGYERIARVTLGIVRAIRQWIRNNRDLSKQILTLVDWAGLFSNGLKVVTVALSVAAAGFTVLAGAAGALISPLGLVVLALAHVAGGAEYLQTAYETAFNGAIKKTVEFALNSRIFGIAIRDWFKLGALAVQIAWHEAIGFIIGKMADLLQAVAAGYEALLQFQIGGIDIGNWIAAGVAIAKRAFYELTAIALDTGKAVGEIWIDGKAGLLDFWAAVVEKLQNISLSISDIYYTARKTWARIKALASGSPTAIFGLSIELQQIEAEAAEAGKKIRDALNPQEAVKNAAKARADAVTKKRSLAERFDSSESKTKAQGAQQEADDLLSGKKDATSEYIAAERGITAAVTDEMKKRQDAFAAQAEKIRAEIDSIRQEGTNNQISQGVSAVYGGVGAIAKNYTVFMSDALRNMGEMAQEKAEALAKSGMDIDQNLLRVRDYILELARNNPIAEMYKKWTEEMNDKDSGARKEAKTTAEGSFRASEIANGDKDRTQDRIAQAVENNARHGRDSAKELRDLNAKLNVAS